MMTDESNHLATERTETHLDAAGDLLREALKAAEKAAFHVKHHGVKKLDVRLSELRQMSQELTAILENIEAQVRS